jgi:hypothetical protein
MIALANTIVILVRLDICLILALKGMDEKLYLRGPRGTWLRSAAPQGNPRTLSTLARQGIQPPMFIPNKISI